ncbi:IS91 family transposase, partial [Sporomusa sp.]|uniref:IS91 family transposase n=1 Tax=Sporomusa sp. TaxID=2078658 RepID=UPI002CEAC82D
FDAKQNWKRFVEKYGKRIRPVVRKEVKKFEHCGDPKQGFKLFVCEGCHDVKIVAYRCRSRFCTSCSSGEAEEWSRVLSHDAYQVMHRHVVFTIDEELRPIFAKHRYLLKELMDRSVKLVQEFFQRKSKVMPGIIAGLHTFGAKAQFNPHVHMMVTMGGMTAKGEWKQYDFLPFEMLRKQWQTVVLKMLREKLSREEIKRIQPILQQAWNNHQNGFYVYAPKQKGNIKEQLRYIGRYLRHPAIGVSRIIAYDGESVSFRYKDKKDGQEKVETLSVEEFIGRLIQHIPEEYFKLIRHYGIYGRRIRSICRKILGQWQERVKRWIIKMNRIKRRNWSQRQKEQNGQDPAICRRCGNHYEYKGEVCLENGRLVIRYTTDLMARKYLERMIGYQSGNAKKEEKARKTNPTAPQYSALHLFGL